MLSHVLKTLHGFEHTEPKNIDAEDYYRLVLNVRGIAINRPENLSNFELLYCEGNSKTKSICEIR